MFFALPNKKVIAMKEINSSNEIETRINQRKEKALSLGLDEKAELIASELGKKEVFHYVSGGGGLADIYVTTYNKARYVGKATKSSELALEIIIFTTEYDDKSGTKEVNIFTRKKLLLPFLYRSKMVYASETSLQEPSKKEILVFRDEDEWLSEFESMHSRARQDKIKKDNKDATDKLVAKLLEQE